MDNFYNSPDLSELLIQKKTDVYGTLKKKRDTNRFKKKIPNDSNSFWLDIKEIKCMIKNVSYLQSTVYCLEKVILEKRKKEISRPHWVHTYNDIMDEVDRVRSDICLTYSSS